MNLLTVDSLIVLKRWSQDLGPVVHVLVLLMPELTAAQLSEMKSAVLYRPVKKQITVRVDADVLAWLKSQGKDYQSRMNAILRREVSPPANRPHAAVWLNLSSLTEAFKLLGGIGPIQRDALAFTPLAEIIGDEVYIFAISVLLCNLAPRLRITDAARVRKRVHGYFCGAGSARFTASLGAI